SPGTGDAAAVGTATAGAPSSRQSRTWMMAGIAVVSLAVAAIIGLKFVMFRQAPAEKPVTAANPLINKSIAVLPFADLSEKKDQGYFADGIAQEILDRLEKVPGLRIVGHVSSFRFKDKSDSP